METNSFSKDAKDKGTARTIKYHKYTGEINCIGSRASIDIFSEDLKIVNFEGYIEDNTFNLEKSSVFDGSLPKDEFNLFEFEWIGSGFRENKASEPGFEYLFRSIVNNIVAYKYFSQQSSEINSRSLKLKPEATAIVQDIIKDLGPEVERWDFYAISHLIYSIKIGEYTEQQRATLHRIAISGKYDNISDIHSYILIALYKLLDTKERKDPFNDLQRFLYFEV